MSTDTDERTIDGWEVPPVRPFIVCAACRRQRDGLVIAGARHFDNIMTSAIAAMTPEGMPRDWVDADQGFIDQWGRFYDRREAAMLAAQNGQCDPDLFDTHLFSEDLY